MPYQLPPSLYPEVSGRPRSVSPGGRFCAPVSRGRLQHAGASEKWLGSNPEGSFKGSIRDPRDQSIYYVTMWIHGPLGLRVEMSSQGLGCPVAWD